jgi:uncharacterized protein YgiM (DUF1202 family)
MRFKLGKLKIYLLVLLTLWVNLTGGVSFAAQQKFGIITADEVNVRALPSSDAALLTQLDLGTQVELLESSDGWCKILLGDTVGYVSQSYIFDSSEGSRGAYVKTDGAYLRGGPSQASYVVCELFAGQGIKVKTIVGDWYFAIVNDQAGYIHRTYLTMTSAPTAAGASQLKVGMEGEEVKKLQTQLYERGFLGQDGVTGTFGAKTRSAIADYQKAAGLASDGVAGTETLNSIFDPSNTLKKSNALFTQLKGSVVMLDWFKGGSDWLAKGAKFTITDVRTGKSFNARRFGGWYHADSEPLSKADTAVIKSLEGFSWNRRPAWVTYRGKTVAASIHTMPHMANPTQNDGFDGHFCVHLLNSKVHETSKACPRHQACVQEAYRAGRAK